MIRDATLDAFLEATGWTASGQGLDWLAEVLP